MNRPLAPTASPIATRTYRNAGFLLLFFITLFLGYALAIPHVALAKDYTMGPVDIAATVSTDGSMAVSEQRTYDFDGDYTYVYWDIDASSVQGVNVTGVGSVDGSVSAYTETTDASSTSSHPSGYYYVENEANSIVRVYAYFRASSTKVTLQLDYTVTGAVTAWADTGELYWKYVGSNWDKSASDITMTLTLPVAQGQTVVAGDNVRAWGHGPLDGDVTFNSNGTISFTCPAVSSNTYLEARVAFPVDWLTGMTPSSTSQLDSIITEETGYADTANAQRTQARILVWGGIALAIVLSLLSLILVIRGYLKYGREYKPKFQDEYLREMPSDDHPAVLGALWRWGDPTDQDFTATLMRLTDQREIKLEKVQVEQPGVFGSKLVDDFLLSRTDASRPVDSIDAAAYDLLFTTIAQGADHLYFSQIKAFGKANPQEFIDAMDAWKGEVGAQALVKDFFEQKGATRFVTYGIWGVALGVLAVGMAFVTSSFIPAIVGIPCAIAIIVIARRMKRRSPAAAETYARCVALKRWLTDFSALDESIPTDVELWDKFMVMAVVFGVADEVIKQMSIKVPEVLADPGFAYTYMWVYPWVGMGSPSAAFATTMADTVHLSQAAISGSSMSSGGGFGGGFSGGGGGGFGGGGGGGAG